MAFTQADLDAINEAISTVLQSASMGDGRSATLRPIDDLLKQKAIIEESLNGKALGVRPVLIRCSRRSRTGYGE